ALPWGEREISPPFVCAEPALRRRRVIDGALSVSAQFATSETHSLRRNLPADSSMHPSPLWRQCQSRAMWFWEAAVHPEYWRVGEFHQRAAAFCVRPRSIPSQSAQVSAVENYFRLCLQLNI